MTEGSIRSFDADFPLADQDETNTVVENECDNEYKYMVETNNTITSSNQNVPAYLPFSSKATDSEMKSVPTSNIQSKAVSVRNST